MSRYSFSAFGRSTRRSICDRVASMSLSYWTPDGQAVTQAMQPRHWSRWRVIDASIGSPSSPSFMR